MDVSWYGHDRPFMSWGKLVLGLYCPRTFMSWLLFERLVQNVPYELVTNVKGPCDPTFLPTFVIKDSNGFGFVVVVVRKEL